METNRKSFLVYVVLFAAIIVVIRGCGRTQNDISFQISQKQSTLIFDFKLINYHGRGLSEGVEATIERLIVRDHNGIELHCGVVDEVTIDRTYLGRPVVRLCLDNDVIQSKQELTGSALLCLSDEHYILFAIAERHGASWRRKQLPAYGLRLLVVPVLCEEIGPVATRDASGNQSLTRAFMLWPASRHNGEGTPPRQSFWQLAIVDENKDVLLKKSTRVEHEGKILKFSVSPEMLKAKKDIWLVLRGVVESRNFLYKWRLSLNDKGEWVLTELPDYGEVFKSAIGLSTDPVAKDEFWQDQPNH